ncbi:MAG: histidine--tRNA ligase [Kiritimatiellia bacterium]
MQYEAPRGMRDFYPEDMSARRTIFDAWRKSAELFGFLPYDACVVESLELLKRKGGEEIVGQIYAFRDKSDRELALRPEMTPTLARMITARRNALTLPLKWFTIAQCFRYERMSRGRKREHYQWNLDIVGADTIQAEAEVIACAAEALRVLGLGAQDIAIHLNSRALLSELLAGAGVPPDCHAATFLALDKRGKLDDAAINQLLSESGLDDAAIAAVWKVMEIGTLEEAGALLGSASPALADLRELLKLLDNYGLAGIAQFDIGVIRGLGYYTGVVFEAFDRQRQFRAIFGGGRYDRLLSDLGGAEMPAVGLGFGDVVIAELLADRKRLPDGPPEIACAVGYMTENERLPALRAARNLRQTGVNTDLALKPEKPKQFFSRVGRGGYREAIFLGPDDCARGTMRVKDLQQRSERELPLPE